MSFFNRVRASFYRSNGLRPAYFNAHLKNCDVFERMDYAPSLAALQQTPIPSIIGFRVKHGGPIPPSLKDPRPSFAILESDAEIASWQKVFHSHISYEYDIDTIDEELELHRLVNFHKPVRKTYEAVSEKPLLRWNGKPSVLPDSPLCFSGAAFLPAVNDADWPPLSVTMGPLNFDNKAARGRYGFEQPPLRL